jgi:hypothetical protein
MPQLTVMLIDGFLHDEVVVTVDGVEVARREAVSTQLLTGVAESIRVDSPEGTISVGISVPSNQSQPEAVIEVPSDATILADLRDGELDLREGTGREGAM